MDGDYASVMRRQLGRGEFASVLVRLAILVGLAVAYILTGGSSLLLDAGNLVAAAVVVIVVAYSALSLRLLASNAFGPLLADLSAVLDAATVSVFLWLALGPAGGGPPVGLAVAAAATFPLVLSVSLVRLSTRNSAVAASACTVGAAACVLPRVIASSGSVSLAWLIVPAGCLLQGAVVMLVSISVDRLLKRHLATRDLHRASRRLRMTMEIVQVSIANLGQFVNNLERVSATLSEGARNQARSIDRVSSAITALNSSQEQIYHSTEISAKTIRRTVDSSDTGNRVVKRVIEEVRSISDVVERMVSSLELIDDIADNTNLLALNANIEANRSGAESMGFSVVADEIRKLAEQSQATALEVGRLVKQITKVISTADASSTNAGAVFEKINTDLAGYSEYVDSLHLSVQEQLKANREVQRAISRIHEVTVDNTQAADRVREVVGELQKEVAKLKALVDGKVTETASLS